MLVSIVAHVWCTGHEHRRRAHAAEAAVLYGLPVWVELDHPSVAANGEGGGFEGPADAEAVVEARIVGHLEIMGAGHLLRLVS